MSGAHKHKPISAASQSNRIRYRNKIEEFCNAVETLPPAKKILFRLYFRYGYKMWEIALLCKVDETTVGRRLRKIAQEIENIIHKSGGLEKGRSILLAAQH